MTLWDTNHCEHLEAGPSACWLQARRLSGEDRWKGAFELRKHKDKFIFTIESTGGQPVHFVLARDPGHD